LGGRRRVDYEQATGKITFGDNKIAVNDLALAFEGPSSRKATTPNSTCASRRRTPRSSRSCRSCRPCTGRTFANISVAGTLGLEGTVKGLSSGENLPGFDLALSVRDGRFQVPQVPTAVDAIAIDAKVKHPQGVADLTTVQVDRFHFAVAGNPVDGRLSLSRPVSDPTVDCDDQGGGRREAARRGVRARGTCKGGEWTWTSRWRGGRRTSRRRTSMQSRHRARSW
jgi:hypothetical protein